MPMLSKTSTDVSLHQILVDYVEVLYHQGAFEQAIGLTTDLAYWESKEYVGYLSSIRLEELLYKMGASLFPVAKYKGKKEAQRKVLHIGTEFYNVGGHTKVAIDWIQNDKNSLSELLVIHQQQAVDLPENIPTHYLKGKTTLERATQLRQFVEENYYDVIVLHQHMEDVVTTLALWDLKEASDTLILFYNHSNFRFSLGNIVAHKRINICEGDVVISEKYRYPLEEDLLYFILGDRLASKLPAQEMKAHKAELGIEQNQTVFFSIGSAYKYTPFEEQNFFEEWNEFLSRQPNCVLVLVGCDEMNFKQYCPNSKRAANFLLLGRVTNPTKYYQIADYIVDIYPLQTGLGTLNGLYYGLPPILPYKETAMVLGKEMNKLYPAEIETHLAYSNRKEYFAFIEEELNTGAYKTWASPIIENHVEEKLLLQPWQAQLEKIYSQAPKSVKNADKRKDILNLSTPSQRWYAFTDTPTRSFNLMILAFRYNIPISFKLLRMYMRLIFQHKSLKGAGLKTFFAYLRGSYKTGA